MRKTAPVASPTVRATHLIPAKVAELEKSWRDCMSSDLGNLFNYIGGQDNGLERYSTFQLKKEDIDQIVDKLDYSSGNVTSLSVLMGCIEESGINRFQPIIEVGLKEEQEGGKLHYFFPVPLKNFLPVAGGPEAQILKAALAAGDSLSNANQEISPRVAEIFMLKWQCLTNEEVVNSFEGVTPNKVSIQRNNSDDAEIIFGTQRIRRVLRYNFVEIESKEIIKKLREAVAQDPQAFCFLQMGAGLKVANFHPFDFRPIIQISSESSLSIKVGDRKMAADDDDGDTSYFDTSKPCPPFCPR